MFAAIKSAWALFLGIALIMLGNGLQGSLLGIRGAQEGFSTGVIGLVMSGYFAGFLLGSFATPRMVTSVGHIRVFAALASMASTAVLLHVVFVDPWAWTLMRVVTGFCYAGLYVVAESWLNDRATNQTRGQLLSFYMIILLGSMGGGQLLLNLSDPRGFQLFILSSILISLALVPILLHASPAPAFETRSSVGLLQLYRLSPLGVVASFGTGLAHAALFGMAAVYAEKIGLSVTSISLFVGMIFLGGIIFQWPLGRLSDRFDRRQVLTVVTLLAALTGVFAALWGTASPLTLFLTMIFFGGMCMPQYSLCIAHTNDHLTPDQMVAAAGTLYVYVGVGASLGPLSVATLMEAVGAEGYWIFLAGVEAAIGLFALYRMTRRQAVPLDEQGLLVPIASTATSVAGTLSAKTLRDQMDRDLAAMSRSRMGR
jgi:MFS family permease